MHRLSIRSTSTGSSLLSDNSRSEPLSSSSQSEPHRRRSLPGFGQHRNISGGGSVGREVLQHTWFQADSLCEFNTGGQSTRNDHSQPELVAELRSRGIWQQDSVDDQKDAADTRELAAIFHGAPGCGLPQKDAYSWNENDVRVGPQESPVWAELSCGSEKKKNTTALNAVSVSNNFPILLKAIYLYTMATHGCGSHVAFCLCVFVLLSNDYLMSVPELSPVHPSSSFLGFFESSILLISQRLCTVPQQYTISRTSPCISVSQALKEIARVSEELCSYQDEIRKKSGDKR